ASRLGFDALNSYGSGTISATSSARVWADREDRYATPDTPERVWADLDLASVRGSEQRYGDSWAMKVRALELARRIDQPETLFAAVGGTQGNPSQVPAEHWSWVTELAGEFASASTRGVTVRTLARTLHQIGYRLLTSGDRA